MAVQSFPAGKAGGGIVATEGKPALEQPAPDQPWPHPRTAWLAVCVFALALMFAELDRGVIQLLIEPIKHDFHLTDTQMSLLLGLSVVVFYAFIGIPMSRLVDTMPRNVILSIGIAVWSGLTACCGLAQNFWQLFFCRIFVGAGGAIHGPGTYSMMADYFPRERLPRAIAVMQIGFIMGGGLALVLGAAVIQAIANVPPIHVPFVGVIRNWQLVFICVGLPGLVVALLQRLVPEPPRRGRLAAGGSTALPLGVIVRYLGQHWRVYGPMFLGLALSAVESFGTAVWRAPFFQRTYGWTVSQAGYNIGLTQIVFALTGLVVGTRLTEYLTRRYDDANMRAVAIFYSLSFPFSIIAPLMPNPWVSIVCSSFAYMCGIGGAVPQNAAMQSITPNEMRGQITAFYLFIFTVLGFGVGPTFISVITNYVLHDESMLRYSMAGSAAIMGPLACLIMWLGVRPYGRAIAEVKRREAVR